MSDFFLADDLSGALDAAAAFHHTGRRVRIVLDSAAWAGSTDDEIVGITTETRNATPAAAEASVARALVHAHARGSRLVYKKIDSTLRGPVAAELRALLTVLPDVRILFAPANPAVGRTVVRGVLRVHGVPVAETEFGRDPVSPVTEGDVRALLGDAPFDRVVVPDAESEADLARAVAETAATCASWIGVGSGALARPVAAHLAGAARANTPVTNSAESNGAVPGGVLFVCGSAHQRNRAQAEALAAETKIPCLEVKISNSNEATENVRRSLTAGGAAMLMLQQERCSSDAALRTISEAAHRVIVDCGVKRLFVTGGETAYALCRALGVAALEFTRELEPGLSLSEGRTPQGTWVFAIKPGGFGDERTWIRAWQGLGG